MRYNVPDPWRKKESGVLGVCLLLLKLLFWFETLGRVGGSETFPTKRVFQNGFVRSLVCLSACCWVYSVVTFTESLIIFIIATTMVIVKIVGNIVLLYRIILIVVAISVVSNAVIVIVYH